MSHQVVKSHSQYNLDCYQLSAPVWQVQRLLGHDPRSKHWKALEPWLKDIYELKQRSTSQPRIDALKLYIKEHLMSKERYGALPPISIIQFEPLAKEQIKAGENGSLSIDEGKTEVNRVLIDGLARYTAAAQIREELKTQSPEWVEELDNAFEFSIALYVPTEKRIGPEVAGQLFSDFNSYAWAVPAAKNLAQDLYNPYKAVALAAAGPQTVIARYGGIKSGTSNLGRKDTAFATELMLSQFCKVAIEGAKGMGKLNKPVSNPRIAKLNPQEEGAKIADFFDKLEKTLGKERFSDRTLLWRTAHGLYAVAVLVNDALYEGRATIHEVINGLAQIDWTWNNKEFSKNIAQTKPTGEKKLNTGAGTTHYLVSYCRPKCGIMMQMAA